MPFSGELVHAAWLDWLGSAAPDVATWLHEGNKRRLFTCSSLQFSLPPEKMLEVERRNVHWPLSPEKTYTIRVTLLLGELFPLFHRALTDFTHTSTTARVKPLHRATTRRYRPEPVRVSSRYRATMRMTIKAAPTITSNTAGRTG